MAPLIFSESAAIPVVEGEEGGGARILMGEDKRRGWESRARQGDV